ncbi:MAG: 4'-phosphopantetheinyl transferase superfamily protein [Chromatiales bacterium]|nr:4'-phosphopantetheinyl transferase superfamily protein [Chromatiales bacterium]
MSRAAASHPLPGGLLPAACAAHLSQDPGSDDPGWPALAPAELEASRSMRPRRAREFHHGRHCARQALARLGLPALPLPQGEDRAPCWPAGVTGSISHSGSWAIAAVALARDLAGLGLDIEPDDPLPLDVHALVCRPGEARRFDGMGTDPARLLFSAKESLYKCLWPLTGRFLEFSEIELSPAPGGFTARYCGQGAPLKLDRLIGRIGQAHGLVLTAAWIPAAGSG